MTNPTSNFGWQMPTSTDLVTDLPADFEVFGQAVDTSMADLKGGTSGQVLSKNSNTDMDFVWVTSDDANAIQNAIVDAKGDLITATAADTPARLAVGTNGQTLVADSSTATGLKWATASSGALTKITSATFSAVSDTGTTFDDVFSSTYNNYKIVFSNLNTSAAAPDYLFRLRTSGGTTKTTQYYGNILSNGTNASQSNTASYKLIVSGAGEVSGLDMTFFRDGAPASWAFNGFQRASNQHVTGAGFNDGVGANVATGFILSASTGTVSGIVAVYGLAD